MQALLFRDEARVYCTPEYAAAMHLAVPQDLVNANLLVTTIQPYWEQWFKRFSQLDAEAVTKIPRIHFDQASVGHRGGKAGPRRCSRKSLPHRGRGCESGID